MANIFDKMESNVKEIHDKYSDQSIYKQPDYDVNIGIKVSDVPKEIKEEIGIDKKEEEEDETVNLNEADQPDKKRPKFKISYRHRRRLIYYLTEFYSKFPDEKFTIFHFVN